MNFWILSLCLSVLAQLYTCEGSAIPCTDENGRPQRCIPPFQNIAYNKRIAVTNTCGLNGPQQFCLQIGTGDRGQERDAVECRMCDEGSYATSHSARFLTDFNNMDNKTWWQSETMLEGIQYPATVNLTLRLGKQFEITYIRLRFKSSRPESLVMYKRTSENSRWQPYQYFSGSCEETYSLRRDSTITPADETKAICTSEYSDIIPLSGGFVLFSTLAGRPGAYDYDNSPQLQEWTTATDIRISLNRINTYGDEVFGYYKVLQSYFYAISDFAVGGRCKCNGHASECTASTGGGVESYACNCEHNTQGVSCQECAPFYNDRPWAPATADSANECQACNCNGRSNRCYFDEELYRRTGHGGHCISCLNNTAGVNCERCKENYYRRREDLPCLACNCHPEGSVGPSCNSDGVCRCKPGVTGDKCDRCAVNHYDFGPFGCRPCECSAQGSYNNIPVCSQDSGMCQCKEYVEGQNCDSCKPGYFGLSASNPLGCLACFCFGHSSVCDSARGYNYQVIQSDFSSGNQGWRGGTLDGRDIELRYDGVSQNVGLSSPSSEQVYFIAPDRYLGDQRFSYSRNLSFTLRVGEDGATANYNDVVIEGDGITVRAPIYSQGNPVPRTFDQDYHFILHEHQRYQWSPSLSSREFIRMLSNLDSIKIRATYTNNGFGFLDNVKLESARVGGVGASVSHVEQCRCLDGYVGQFCESCAPGYHRDPANGGPLARCVPCNCNGHSDVCDVQTGKCICQHNTVGDTCERCAPGYYGYPLVGTPNDCKPCPCPGGGECVELLNGDVACINCQEGYIGNRCEMCADGFYGDPQNNVPCRRCECNDNVDPNSILNCDSRTGQCLKCVLNTGGDHCEVCLPGFYGNALASPASCQPCNCYGPGSRGGASGQVVSCDANGQCPCLRNVEGERCDQCRDGFWNIQSGTGCESCNCNLIGSHNKTCDIQTGRCRCKPGVNGDKCEECMPNHYGFSSYGCRACECDPYGSTSLQCNVYTGACPCKDNIDGVHCDQCMENKYNISAGCIDCPACYNLVQDAVNALRRELENLQEMIDNIGENPENIDDADFRSKMRAVNDSVNQLLEDARNAVGGDGSVAAQVEAMRAALMAVMETCGRIHGDLVSGQTSSAQAQQDLDAADQLISRALRELSDAESYMDTEGREALMKAKEAQDRAGQQSARLTDIAKEAQQLATDQESDATRIRSTADEALNTSTEALRIVREAMRLPGDTDDKIRQINQELSSIQALYEQTQQMSEAAYKKADEALNQGTNIAVQAEDLVENLDVQALRDEAQRIKDEAADIKQRATDLIDDHADLIASVERQKQMAEDLLSDGIRQQQVLDELLGDADVAKSIALDAVARAEKTLKDAQDTLQTLKDFDAQVRESKDEAEEALKRIPEIQRQIQEAENATSQANFNLADALEDAINARDIGAEANDTASSNARDAASIAQQASDNKDRSMELNTEAEDLSRDVDDAEQRLNDLDNQADAADIAAQAIQKAEQAIIAADDADRMVSTALEDVEKILAQLDALGDIDVNALDDLEAQLDQVEADLSASQINIRIDEIMSARDEQFYYKDRYVIDLQQLSRDVENIKVINETIPRICYKSIELEPVEEEGRFRRGATQILNWFF